MIRVEDGTDLRTIEEAICEAQGDTERPTLIEIKTVIGYGSPNKGGKSASHGSPLGESEIALVKEAYGWPSETPFYVPEEVRELFSVSLTEGQKNEDAWNRVLEEYVVKYPDAGKTFMEAISNKLPENFALELPVYKSTDAAISTRQASGNALNALAKRTPMLMGGSADLQGSNVTNLKGLPVFHAKDYSGRNVWFGVREHAMGAALNGMALHGGVRVYGGTFLVFCDYLRPSIRLAALMKLPVIYVFTHDSIAVGEDGPTHEPVEQIASLRCIPGMKVIRPADGNETSEAWKFALENQEGPVALILTRQNLPILEGTAELAQGSLQHGGYVLSDMPNPQGILIATGSEVSLAIQAQQKLAEEGISTRVVSMPSMELFEKQSAEYKESVLPKQLTTRIAIEAASPFGWERYVGSSGRVLGISGFGASAPGELLMKAYGFTVENVVSNMRELLS